jgi:hypothetical protein
MKLPFGNPQLAVSKEQTNSLRSILEAIEVIAIVNLKIVTI